MLACGPILDHTALAALPVGAVLVATRGYRSERCQNPDYLEVDPGVAWQLGPDDNWYPIACMSVWCEHPRMAALKPFCVYNPDTYPKDQP